MLELILLLVLVTLLAFPLGKYLAVIMHNRTMKIDVLFNWIEKPIYAILGTNPKQGMNVKTYILSFPDGGARLEIMSRPEVTEPLTDIFRGGFIHVSIALGSKNAVDAKTEELKTAGYECISGPRTTGDGYYESCIVGPEGILIEITV